MRADDDAPHGPKNNKQRINGGDNGGKKATLGHVPRKRGRDQPPPYSRVSSSVAKTNFKRGQTSRGADKSLIDLTSSDSTKQKELRCASNQGSVRTHEDFRELRASMTFQRGQGVDRERPATTATEPRRDKASSFARKAGAQGVDRGAPTTTTERQPGDRSGSVRLNVIGQAARDQGQPRTPRGRKPAMSMKSGSFRNLIAKVDQGVGVSPHPSPPIRSPRLVGRARRALGSPPRLPDLAGADASFSAAKAPSSATAVTVRDGRDASHGASRNSAAHHFGGRDHSLGGDHLCEEHDRQEASPTVHDGSGRVDQQNRASSFALNGGGGSWSWGRNRDQMSSSDPGRRDGCGERRASHPPPDSTGGWGQKRQPNSASASGWGRTILDSTGGCGKKRQPNSSSSSGYMDNSLKQNNLPRDKEVDSLPSPTSDSTKQTVGAAKPANANASSTDDRTKIGDKPVLQKVSSAGPSASQGNGGSRLAPAHADRERRQSIRTSSQVASHAGPGDELSREKKRKRDVIESKQRSISRASSPGSAWVSIATRGATASSLTCKKTNNEKMPPRSDKNPAVQPPKDRDGISNGITKRRAVSGKSPGSATNEKCGQSKEMLPGARSNDAANASKSSHQNEKRTRCSWQERYEELKAYRQEHGDCCISTKSGPLGGWVSTQRTEYRKMSDGKRTAMTEERVAKLEEIGFLWNAKMTLSRMGKGGAKVVFEERFRNNEAPLQALSLSSSSDSDEEVSDGENISSGASEPSQNIASGSERSSKSEALSVSSHSDKGVSDEDNISSGASESSQKKSGGRYHGSGQTSSNSTLQLINEVDRASSTSDSSPGLHSNSTEQATLVDGVVDADGVVLVTNPGNRTHSVPLPWPARVACGRESEKYRKNLGLGQNHSDICVVYFFPCWEGVSPAKDRWYQIEFIDPSKIIRLHDSVLPRVDEVPHNVIERFMKAWTIALGLKYWSLGVRFHAAHKQKKCKVEVPHKKIHQMVGDYAAVLKIPDGDWLDKSKTYDPEEIVKMIATCGPRIANLLPVYNERLSTELRDDLGDRFCAFVASSAMRLDGSGSLPSVAARNSSVVSVSADSDARTPIPAMDGDRARFKDVERPPNHDLFHVLDCTRDGGRVTNGGVIANVALLNRDRVINTKQEEGSTRLETASAANDNRQNSPYGQLANMTKGVGQNYAEKAQGKGKNATPETMQLFNELSKINTTCMTTKLPCIIWKMCKRIVDLEEGKDETESVDTSSAKADRVTDTFQGLSLYFSSESTSTQHKSIFEERATTCPTTTDSNEVRFLHSEWSVCRALVGKDNEANPFDELLCMLSGLGLVFSKKTQSGNKSKKIFLDLSDISRFPSTDVAICILLNSLCERCLDLEEEKEKLSA